MMIPSIVAKVLKWCIECIFFIEFVSFLVLAYLIICMTLSWNLIDLSILAIKLAVLASIAYGFAWILHKLWLFVYEHEEIKGFKED